MSVIKVRASSLSELFDCPKRFEARHILKMYQPTNYKAWLGTSIHAGTEAFDRAVLDGSPIRIDDAVDVFVEKLRDSTVEEIDWEDEGPAAVENIGINLVSKYCQFIAPEQNYVAVELSCNSLVITDIGLELTGTTDRVRQLQDDRLGIADIKTGKTAVASDDSVKTAGHIAQMGVYTLLAEHELKRPIEGPAQIIGMQTGKTKVAQRVGFGDIENPKAILVGDEMNEGILQHASKILHSGSFYGNPKSQLCSDKFCPAYATCRWVGN